MSARLGLLAKMLGIGLIGGAVLLPQKMVQSAPSPSISVNVISSSQQDEREQHSYQTPFAAVGKQSVIAILPESDGVGNEDWTEPVKQRVLSDLAQSFTFWENLLPKQGQLERRIGAVFYPKIPYEPITMPKSDHLVWRNASIKALGYSSELDLISKIKREQNADSAFIVYIVNASSQINKSFPAGPNYPSISGSYAADYPNNSFMVLLSQSPKGDPVLIDAHEAGHIAGAADLRPGNPDCTRKGALNWPSCEGISPTEDELMRNGKAYVSTATKAQTGIIDHNNNGVPDSVDMPPNFKITKNQSEIIVDIATSGIEPQNPLYPYFNYSTLKTVEAKIDGDSYAFKIPQNSKKVKLKISNFDAGQHSLEILAETQFGNKATSTYVFTRELLPEAPLLILPQDHAQLGGLEATLTWKNSPGTTQYHLQIMPFGNDGPGINVIKNADETYTVKAPLLGSGPYVMLPGMTYTWRVRTATTNDSIGENDANWGEWSERKFKTATASSSTISNASPATSSSPATLQWTDSNKGIFYYEVQMSGNPQFDTNTETATSFVFWNLVHGGITTPLNSWKTPNLPRGTYSWRVRPRIQGDGTPAAWSETYSIELK